MIALSSMKELKSAERAMEELSASKPDVFEYLLHIISLTRQLQLNYQYAGCLLMDEDPGKNAPNYVRYSVIDLYLQEVQSIKNHKDFNAVRQLFTKYKEIGYTNISMLVLGKSPESLKGIEI